MKNLLLIGSFLILSIFPSCLKKCNETMDNVRPNPKDTSLMYLWRYTDNLIVPDKLATDSGYIYFKPNGDYAWEFTLKEINQRVPEVWYTKDSIIFAVHCVDANVSVVPDFKYRIIEDTLYLYGTTGTGKLSFGINASTYIKVKKYTQK